jgi:long-chain acyl-CoA synthetase
MNHGESHAVLPGAAALLPAAPMVQDRRRNWSAQQFRSEVAGLAAHLQAADVRVLATLMDNSAAWIAADLAAVEAGAVHVPLPTFFTPGQIQHALAAAGVDAVLAAPAAAQQLLAASGASGPKAAQAACSDRIVADEPLVLLRLPVRPVQMPAGTAKITFTSGTTGTPKGVCLSQAAMQGVAESLAQATAALGITRHLCALPLAVLLENIAGVLAPFSRNATCVVLPLQELGLTGSSGFDAAAFHAAVQEQQPHSLILLPQMLRAWAAYLHRQREQAPRSLRLVAVGGAAVGERTLQQARAAGIPAYEGYGLSEGASVQTLNLPGADRPGSAGRALPHARLRCSGDGEIEVAGSLFLGYLGLPASSPGAWWPTGDLGRIDAEGFVHVMGRRKHVLITAFGRNVSPEWVETALRSEPAIAQAVVLGDGQPHLSAVLWPQADAADAALDAAVQAANAGLPDYARVSRWVRAQAAFNAATGLATANGRPQRAAIERMHAQALGLEPAAAPTHP